MVALSVTPLEARLDEPMTLRASGLTPRARMRLRLRNHRLRAEAGATFLADERGIVDLALHAPIEGDYDSIDAAGLFWSARFDEGADAATMITALSSLDPLSYTATAEVDGVEVATLDFTRTLLAPKIVRTPVRHGRLRGTLFTPQDSTGSPAVIVLGGSDGGDLYTFVAALLAARGMTALSLAYFGQDDLPKELIGIPVEYFLEAVAWLGTPAILGFSRGAEAALLTASRCPDVRAVVAMVPGTLTGGGVSPDPSAMVKSAWTLDGQPLPLLPPVWDQESMKEVQEAFSAGKPLAARRAILRGLESAGARVNDVAIKVEQTRGPILLMSGEDDQLWPCTRFAELAEERLRAARFPYAFEHRRYPEAGHFACLPPNLPARTAVARHPLFPMPFAFGGSPRGNAAASADVWPRIVAFLRQHLAAAATTT